MNLIHPLRAGQRLASIYRLSLLLLGALALASLVLAGRASRQVERFDTEMLPSVRLVHSLNRLVDDGRGMAALHLLVDDAVERQSLEQDLLRQRARITAQIDAYAARSLDAADRGHLGEVRARLVQDWAAQDKLLDASRHAHADPAQAGAARALLNGESQQSWRAVVDALDAWWRHHDAQAGAAAGAARSALALLRLTLGGAAATALLALAAAIVRRRPPLAAQVPPPDSGVAADGGARDRAATAQWQALQAAMRSPRSSGAAVDIDVDVDVGVDIDLGAAPLAGSDAGKPPR